MTTYVAGVMLIIIGVIALCVVGFIYLSRQETHEVERIFRRIRGQEDEK